MNLSELPRDLPKPEDDGAASHLPGARFPALAFPSTGAASIVPARLQGSVVLYIYPMTGRPDTPLPEGWDALPGARGCTPQSCAFRDHRLELRALGACVFGLSAQDTGYQSEARERLHLGFDLLSDSNLTLKGALSLPTFEIAGMELYKRMTLVLRKGRICKVFYPVFPPDANAAEVVSWLRANPGPAAPAEPA